MGLGGHYHFGATNLLMLDKLYSLDSIKASLLNDQELISFIDNVNPILDYEHFTFNKMNFNKLTFLKTSFQSGIIKNCNFSDANFYFSNFSSSTFINVNNRQTNFSGSNFNYANLQWMYGIESIFFASELKNTNFHGSNLYGSNFEKTTLDKTDFSLCCLQEANFNGATGSCNFDGSNLTKTSLIGIDVSKISCKEANLTETLFIAGHTENEISFELDILECHLKNHSCEIELKRAIEQNVIRKISQLPPNLNKNKLETSDLLKHSLFTIKKNESYFNLNTIKQQMGI